MTNKKSAIDMEFLRSVIEDDREFERELFAIFTENAQSNLVKMNEAIAADDSNAWYMASHAFKGAAASIGAFELSKALEYAQRHPEDESEAKVKILSRIKEEFERVIEFINEELMGG